MKELLKHRKAFELYYKLGKKRSYAKLSEKIDEPLSTVERWGAELKWQKRVEERDSEIANKVAEKNIAEQVDIQAKIDMGINGVLDLFLTNLSNNKVKAESVQDFERVGKLFLEIKKLQKAESVSTQVETVNVVKPFNLVWDINGEPNQELDEKEEPFYDNKGNIYLNRTVPKIYNQYVNELLFKDSTDYIELILKGGRYGVKSTIDALITVLRPWLGKGDAVATRNIYGKLRDSCFAMCVDVIRKLGIEDDFEWGDKPNSPLFIRCVKTGMNIYFYGLDDASKLKSFKPTNGVGWVWLEEAQTIDRIATVRSLKKTFMRSKKYPCKIGYSLNPLPDKQAWTNNELVRPTDTKFILHVNYTDIPRWWLTDEIIAEAEELKKYYPEIYANEMLGEVIGATGTAFKKVFKLTQDIKFSKTYLFRGLDIGYENDPTAYVVWAYDQQKQEIYSVYEAGGEPMYADVIAPYIKAENKHNASVIVDSAALETIRVLSQKGINVEPSSKPKESVKYGLSWLQRLKGIYIDPIKCPRLYKEFTEYAYKLDKNGESTNEFSDKNNHFIDATRYALQRHILHK